MREIRVKNLNEQNLVHVVIAMKNHCILIRNSDYALLQEKAAMTNETKMNFITWYEKCPIKTDIKFRPFCDEFWLIEKITVDDNLVYCYSGSTEVSKKQIVVKAE